MTVYLLFEIVVKIAAGFFLGGWRRDDGGREGGIIWLVPRVCFVHNGQLLTGAAQWVAKRLEVWKKGSY
jgi:hypothetical protein